MVGAEDISGVSQVNMPPGWVWPPSASMRMKGERCLAELAATGTPFQVEQGPIGKIATPVRLPFRSLGSAETANFSSVRERARRVDLGSDRGRKPRDNGKAAVSAPQKGEAGVRVFGMQVGALIVQPVYAKRPPVMDCRLALTLVRHSSAFTALGVRTLITGGFYSERRGRLGGRSLNVLSRHALGLAVDIRAFVTHDGKTLTVTRHYRHPLVQAVEAMLNARGEFRAVVTPGNDRAHRDHFHLSAKMTIDDSQPDQNLNLALLLQQATPRHQPVTLVARRRPRRTKL